MPSITGMCTSISTMSKRCSCTACSASRPFSTKCALWPMRSSSAPMYSRLTALSSATSTCRARGCGRGCCGAALRRFDQRRRRHAQRHARRGTCCPGPACCPRRCRRPSGAPVAARSPGPGPCPGASRRGRVGAALHARAALEQARHRVGVHADAGVGAPSNSSMASRSPCGAARRQRNATLPPSVKRIALATGCTAPAARACRRAARAAATSCRSARCSCKPLALAGARISALDLAHQRASARRRARRASACPTRAWTGRRCR